MKKILANLKVKAGVDERLKGEAPDPAAPGGLHEDIMRAVRISQREGTAPRLWAFRWGPVLALAGLVLMTVWAGVEMSGSKPPQPANQPLAAAGRMLAEGRNYAQSIPSAAVGPMATECERVDADFKQTARFLLASIP